MQKSLREMDEALANQAWLSGNTFSLADIGVLPYVNRLHMLNMSEMWNDRLPHAAHWFERVRARANFYPGIEEHLPANSCEDLLRNGKTGGPELLALCCLG